MQEVFAQLKNKLRWGGNGTEIAFTRSQYSVQLSLGMDLRNVVIAFTPASILVITAVKGFRERIQNGNVSLILGAEEALPRPATKSFIQNSVFFLASISWPSVCAASEVLAQNLAFDLAGVDGSRELLPEDGVGRIKLQSSLVGRDSVVVFATSEMEIAQRYR